MGGSIQRSIYQDLIQPLQGWRVKMPKHLIRLLQGNTFLNDTMPRMKSEDAKIRRVVKVYLLQKLTSEGSQRIKRGGSQRMIALYKQKCLKAKPSSKSNSPTKWNKKMRTSFLFLGLDQSSMSLIYPGPMCIPLGPTTLPRNSTSFWNSSHFLDFNFSPYSLNLTNTALRLARCPSKSFPRTRISSRKARTTFQLKPLSTRLMTLA